MMTIENRSKTAFDDRNHPRLVSFENSNSWIKRHDSQGTLVIQAGYQENPGKMARKDNENPVVALAGQSPRWYGSLACESRHVAIHGRSKIETARNSFAACLQPLDHCRDLVVVASHWNQDDFPALQKALLGQYRVIRNGEEIQCAVTQVVPVLEGIGSYHAVKSQLKPGKTLLVELGFGTGEFWIIGSDGEVQDGAPVDALGVYNLANAIAADQTVRSLVQDDSGHVSRSLISAALKADSLGRIDEAQWSAIKAKYGVDFLQSLQGFVTTAFGEHSQSIVNIVLTGGGAALLRSIQPKVDSVFIIPDQPQVASARGSYEFQLSRVG